MGEHDAPDAALQVTLAEVDSLTHNLGGFAAWRLSL
jgi:hypothetical protein